MEEGRVWAMVNTFGKGDSRRPGMGERGGGGAEAKPGLER